MRPGCVGGMERAAHCMWGAVGRLREEPKGDPADDPYMGVQKGWDAERPNTPGCQGQRALHPNHSAQLLLELDATESLVRGRNQLAQVVAGDLFRPGLSGSRDPFSNLDSPQVIPLWENGDRALSFMEGCRGLPLTL